jgi:hypothetical protein
MIRNGIIIALGFSLGWWALLYIFARIIIDNVK